MVSMKVLLTGSSGYLGQHVLHSLLKKATSSSSKDMQIFAPYNSMEGFEDAVKSKMMENEMNDVALNIDKLNFSNQDDIINYFESHGPFDLCLHLGAMSSPKTCQNDPDKTKATNVPIHLFQMLKNTPIVALSTDQVYCGRNAPYKESSTAGPVNVYAQSKLDMESVLLNDDTRLQPVVCLRSSIILGPHAPFGQAHSTFLHFCKSRKDTETTFYTDEIRSVVAVHDVVNILLYFCDKVNYADNDDGTFTCGFESNVYNMGGADNASRMDMAVAVAKHCGFCHHVFVPARKSQITSTINDVPSPLDISMDSSKLEALVGWKFKGLEGSVQATFV
mmetsp:Transcript_5745/g.6451  ORF Transcript_5745/g.6451 Transcript_5745/m.6451 type:complete len:334 (-) Transcript_5745:118-1119(-)